MAILPLGTGNDLARCLRWGGGELLASAWCYPVIQHDLVPGLVSDRSPLASSRATDTCQLLLMPLAIVHALCCWNLFLTKSSWLAIAIEHGMSTFTLNTFDNGSSYIQPASTKGWVKIWFHLIFIRIHFCVTRMSHLSSKLAGVAPFLSTSFLYYFF